MGNLNFKYYFENPWDSNSKPTSPQKDKRKDDANQELEEILKKGREKVMGFLSANKSNAKGVNSTQGRGDDGGLKSWGWFFTVIAFFAICAWLSTGFYTIDTDEQGVVMRFGKYSRISTPGLNWKLPSPIETVEKVSVTRINREVIGFKAQQNIRGSSQDAADDSISIPKESQMLTGDENIIDLHFFVQWYIKNPKDYLFNIKDDFGENTIKVAAESTMRQVIGLAKISEALSEQRQGIEQKAKNMLQDLLRSYHSGIEVVNLGILYSYVAPEVRDAYRDVQSAKADKEREINQAQAYKNDIIPRARGSAESVVQEAMAYKESAIAKAEGDAEKFNSILAQYQKAKDVTRTNMYINAIQEILKDKEKILVDKGVAGKAIPLLSVNDLLSKTPKADAVSK